MTKQNSKTLMMLFVIIAVCCLLVLAVDVVVRWEEVWFGVPQFESQLDKLR